MEYKSPLSTRYASSEMSRLFSEEQRALCFRKLWIALAKAQKLLGLSITTAQIDEMQAQLDKIHLSSIHSHEMVLKHDVMAHIHSFGDLCPKARGIIHLGATSCFVTDNADLMIYKEALTLLLRKLVKVIRALSSFAKSQAHRACVGYTHFQPAQPTTVGKRASLWLQDFLFDAYEWERQIATLPFLGAKGATGTQSSFLSLFNGDHAKVEKLEQSIAKEFHFSKVIGVSGQTYTRKIDLLLLNAMASFAASAHKMATDLRLLAHEGELVESSGKKQVGSSAMPHKQNPIYSERICGVARFVISLSQNGAQTLATQWLERSLDDSSNRRLVMPEAFLAADALLNMLHHLIEHLVVVPSTIQENLEKQIPFLAMENILMTAVKKGMDRQEAHEILRKMAHEAQKTLHPLPFIIENAKVSLNLTKKELEPLLKVEPLIGRAPEQVFSFLKNEVDPFLKRSPKDSLTIPSLEI